MAMTKKPWLMLAAVATAGAVLVGCGSSGDADGDGDQASAATAEGPVGEFDEIIGQALAGETIVECTGAQPGGSEVVHIAGEDRIQFTTTVGDRSMATLISGDEVHQWSDGARVGLTAHDPLAEQIGESIVVQLRQAGAFFDDCTEYTGSEDIFDLPGDVEFTTLSTQAETLAWFAQRYVDGDGEAVLEEQTLGMPESRVEFLLSIAPLLTITDAERADFAKLGDEEMSLYLLELSGSTPEEQQAVMAENIDALDPAHRVEVEEYLASMMGGPMDGTDMDGGMQPGD